MENRKKIVLVTGADAGLGLSLVKRFLRGRLCSLCRRLPGNGLKHLAQNMAIRCPSSHWMWQTSIRARAARQVEERTRVLDIIINNAGIHLENSQLPLEELDFSDQHLQQTMDVNTFGPLRVVQQFLSLMEKGEGETHPQHLIRGRQHRRLASGKINLRTACQRPRSICSPKSCTIT